MAFWGLVLEPKKSYTQREVEQPFHISMAALDLQNCDPNESVSVVCRKRDSDFILCSLSKKHNVFNVPLNLDFELGAEINFHVLGNSAVHLTGYMIEDMESFEESDDSMGEEEESEVSSKDLFRNTKKMLEAAGKRKQGANVQNKSKKVKLDAGATPEEDDEDEDDSDFDMADSDDEDLEEEEEDDDEDDDDDDDEEEDEAAELVQKLEAAKKDKSKQGVKQNNQQVQASPKTEQKQAGGKKEKKDQAQAKPTPTKAVNGSPAQANGAPHKQVLQGGVQIEELRVGNGPAAKSGKMVAVYYVGRLKQNNKQFDSSTSGPGFKFRLGKGEVIPGWDIGVAGMKVGGKRRLTIPPKMGYGAKGAGREIPPNSTLVFEVELKNVK
ncbi:39 kDa [Frankliniella fusca]|uniref:FK506-binding protein n=1 Tax=Frankliniella fusca TaxID=407009 RepID=A0AAE1HYQ0_9NEOP|nr:39 kDa [Frankliniella fusca]